MNTDAETQKTLSRLFASQHFAVLATNDHGQPYTSLMAFVASPDLRQLVVLTDRATCKFANILANSRVALLIDNRENKSTDTHSSIAVTAIGKAQEASAAEGALLLELFLTRHPNLTAFALSPTCVIVTVNIDSYLLISNFQEVIEWHIGA